jgi:hypothetical protein
VVIHKRLDSADTQFVQLENNLWRNPLEQNLEFFDFGQFHQAAANADHIFVRMNKMWEKEVEMDSLESWEEEEDKNNTTPVAMDQTQEDGQGRQGQGQNKRLNTVTRSQPKTKNELRKELGGEEKHQITNYSSLQRGQQGRN